MLYAYLIDLKVVEVKEFLEPPGEPWVPSPDSKLVAEPGFTYLPEYAQFLTPKPYASWTYNPQTQAWSAPVQQPETPWPEISRWSEDLKQWQIFNLEQ
jgi:hypothetical protein